MDYEAYETLKIDRSNRVLTVAFNRPDELNAVNGRMHTELACIFADIAQDTEANAVVLTGNGKAFCAGGDLNWFVHITQSETDRLLDEGRKIILDLLEVEKPIIAAVNGAAIGLGATLALFSDVVIASEQAKIGDPHVRVGLVAGDGGAIIWPWLVGMAKAKQYLLTGDLLNGVEAAAIGLVNRAVPDNEVLPEAYRLAQRLADGPTIAIRGTKASINKILRDAVNLVLDTSLGRERQCFQSEDHLEAVMAFAEKRSPRFVGR